jgi:hypothetical protein
MLTAVDFNKRLRQHLQQAQILERTKPREAADYWVKIAEFCMLFVKKGEASYEFKSLLRQRVADIIAHVKQMRAEFERTSQVTQPEQGGPAPTPTEFSDDDLPPGLTLDDLMALPSVPRGTPTGGGGTAAVPPGSPTHAVRPGPVAPNQSGAQAPPRTPATSSDTPKSPDLSDQDFMDLQNLLQEIPAGGYDGHTLVPPTGKLSTPPSNLPPGADGAGYAPLPTLRVAGVAPKTTGLGLGDITDPNVVDPFKGPTNFRVEGEFCPGCGTTINEAMKKCPMCGMALRE